MIEHHQENDRGRDFFVGDIHGQFRLLEEAMQRVSFDKARDRMFSVGDLIDRGPDSMTCLSLAFEPWFHGVRGNHEMLAYDALRDEDVMPLWLINGGSWLLTENEVEVRQLLFEALRHLPYVREIEIKGKRIGMVHAEPPVQWGQVTHPSNQRKLVWGRSRFESGDTSTVVGIDAVVVGHTIVPEPARLGNVHYIDTGAFTTGRLTLLEAHEIESGIRP